MKWMSRLISVVLAAFWLGITFRMARPAFRGGDAWESFVAGVGDSRRTAAFLVVLAAAAIVLWLLSLRNRHVQPRFMSYETEHGPISISLKALQDFLLNLKEEFNSILSLTPRVTAEEHGLNILLEVNVRSGESVPDMSRRLQQRVRKLVEEKVGISEIHHVEVRIEEIVNQKNPQTVKPEPTPPPAGETP